MNKVILIGTMGSDPETRNLQNGTAVCNFSIATSERWKDKEGNKQEKTEWHRLVFFGRLAEICSEYTGKGDKIMVEGKLQTREWEDKDGNKKYTTEVNVSGMEILHRKDRDQQPPQDKPKKPPNNSKPGQSTGEDVPF